MVQEHPISKNGVQHKGRWYWATLMAGRIGQTAAVDDLDVDDTPELAVRFSDGKRSFAEVLGTSLHNPQRKSAFERALRFRKPFTAR